MRGMGNGNGMGVRNKKQAFRWSLRGGKRQGSSVAAPESCNLGSARPVMGQGRCGDFRNILLVIYTFDSLITSSTLSTNLFTISSTSARVTL